MALSVQCQGCHAANDSKKPINSTALSNNVNKWKVWIALFYFWKREMSGKQAYPINVKKIRFSRQILEFEQI